MTRRDASTGSAGPAGSIHWRSRRGMLELELTLVPFARVHFEGLSSADRQAYARLLEEDDWRIFDWLRGASQPEDPALERIVALIRRSQRCR